MKRSLCFALIIALLLSVQAWSFAESSDEIEIAYGRNYSEVRSSETGKGHMISYENRERIGASSAALVFSNVSFLSTGLKAKVYYYFLSTDKLYKVLFEFNEDDYSSGSQKQGDKCLENYNIIYSALSAVYGPPQNDNMLPYLDMGIKSDTSPSTDTDQHSTAITHAQWVIEDRGQPFLITLQYKYGNYVGYWVDMSCRCISFSDKQPVSEKTVAPYVPQRGANATPTPRTVVQGLPGVMLTATPSPTPVPTPSPSPSPAPVNALPDPETVFGKAGVVNTRNFAYNGKTYDAYQYDVSNHSDALLNQYTAKAEDAGYKVDRGEELGLPVLYIKDANGKEAILFYDFGGVMLLMVQQGMRFSLKETEIKTGEYITFGHYEQDGNTQNGKEPIEWLVLEYDEGTNSVLVISRYGLDCKPYNTTKTDVVWENCSLRNWLNSDFITAAFSMQEQKAIITTAVDNSGSQCYSGYITTGRNSTQDRIFLLSYAEANRYFGVQNWREDGARNNMQSRAEATQYAVSKGTACDDQNTVCWWLRSPGYGTNEVCYVENNGSLVSAYVNRNDYAVRPAFWLDLSGM